MDSNPCLNTFENVNNLFSKTNEPIMSCSSSVDEIKLKSTQSSCDLFSPVVSENNESNSTAGNLSLSSMDYFSLTNQLKTNGIKGKNSPNRYG